MTTTGVRNEHANHLSDTRILTRVESTKPRILCDFEFHFASGELLCVTTEEGRDTAHIATEIKLTVRPEPGVETVLTIERSKLNAWQTTTRTVQPETTTEDAGRIQLVGANA